MAWWKAPACDEGPKSEVRNSAWHGMYAVLAFGSFVFHTYSVLVHLKRWRKG